MKLSRRAKFYIQTGSFFTNHNIIKDAHIGLLMFPDFSNVFNVPQTPPHSVKFPLNNNHRRQIPNPQDTSISQMP